MPDVDYEKECKRLWNMCEKNLDDKLDPDELDQLALLCAKAAEIPDYKIKEVEYRILSVTEETAGEYAVTGMMYARSKFGAIDESRDLVATQQSVSMMNSQGTPVDEQDWEGTANTTKVVVVDNKTAGQGNKKPELEGNGEFDESGLETDGGTITVEVDFCEQLVVAGRD